MRSHGCGELRLEHVGQRVKLAGWEHSPRDHGGLIFIDLRDRWGIVQVVFNPQLGDEVFERAERLRSEHCVLVEGEVTKRLEGMENPSLATGEIEVMADTLTVLSESKTPPFQLDSRADDVDETLRLRYRYLDLRRREMQETLILRHRVVKAVRDFFDQEGFLEIETPMLTKSTPEGARDYLVPSRVHPGSFFALPQSPQLFKQLMMNGGLERYFQITRCISDEDLRADRQPEFTQIDVEMSFVEAADVIGLIERMIAYVFAKTINVHVELPIRRITWQEAMDLYGSDKPDLRFGLPLVDVSPALAGCGFRVFADVLKRGGQVKGINAKGAGTWPRREIDQLESVVKPYGAKGLAWMIVGENGEVRSPIAKFLTPDEISDILRTMSAEPGDLLCFVADSKEIVAESLGRLRLYLGEKLELIDHSRFQFAWIVEWPLLERDADTGKWNAAHHPFTSPVDEDVELLSSDPARVRAKAYDLVLNGVELGGGSIRIHRQDLQEKVFEVLGLSHSEAQEKFGFLLDALQYGAPPHGGIALGLDRLVMLMAGRESIRDCIAFPKTQSAADLMVQAPSRVSEAQ